MWGRSGCSCRPVRVCSSPCWVRCPRCPARCSTGGGGPGRWSRVRSGWGRRRCATALRSAGSRGGGWRSARTLAAAAPGRARRRTAGHLRRRGGGRRAAGHPSPGALAPPGPGSGGRAWPPPRLAMAALLAAVPAGPGGVRGGDRTASPWPSCRATCRASGLDFNAQRQAVLDNHVNATLDLAATGRPVGAQHAPTWWCGRRTPATSTRCANPDAGYRISQAADGDRRADPGRRGAAGPGAGQVRNAGLLWQPGSGVDLAQMYIKRHPVPFAEYVPLRSVARKVSARGGPGPPRLRGRRRARGADAGPGHRRRRHLLRGRLRRHRPGHRHRRRRSCWWCRPTTRRSTWPRPASSWPWCGCAPWSTAGRR